MRQDIPADILVDQRDPQPTLAAHEFGRYLHRIAHIDLPLEAKIELIKALQGIMRSFVDRAFGDDAAQLARIAGDEIHETREARLPPVVSSVDHNNPGERVLKSAFKKGAARGRRKEKR